MKVKQFEFNLFGENTYVIWDESSREAIIVDPGMSNPAEEAELDDYVEANHLKVKAVVLTHMHIDHVLGLGHVCKRYGAPVYANRRDMPLGQAVAQQIEMFHLPYKLGPVELDVNVGDGDTLSLGPHTFQFLEVPGHSPGGIIMYSPDGRFALTGDSIFQGSIGRTDLPGGNHPQLLNAIHSTILTLPPDTVLLPGHGPRTTVAAESRSNPFLR